ncbi:MFS transporter [Candidatus Bathyarchaeota archaeon]|nr:MFS transporter [Candidatus Bathyarchaeota archaeon]
MHLTVNREKYSDTIIVLGVVQFIEALAFFLPQSFYPMYITSLGGTVASVGLFISAFTLSSAVFSPTIGKLSDRLGRKRLILWGLAGDIVFGALTGLAPSWRWLLVVRVLNGALSAAATLPTEALIIDSVPRHSRGEIVGFTSACAMAGRWTGPVFGGVIQHAFNSFGFTLANSYRAPYIVDSLLAAIAFALVTLKVADIKTEHAEKTKPVKRRLRFTASMKAMMFFGFTYGGAIGLTMPLTALLYSDKFGVKPLAIGAIISATGLIGLASSWAAGRVSDRMGRKPVLAIGEGVGRLMGFLLPLMPSVSLTALCHFFRKTGFSVSRPATDALKADVSSQKHRGEFFGYYQTAYRVGDVTFPVIGTYLYATYFTHSFNVAGLPLPGYALPYLLSSSLGLIGLISALLYVESSNKKD